MNYSSPFGYALVAGKLRALIALLVFICLVFITPRAHAQLTDTLRCNSSITIRLGSILAGDSLELPITFINEIGVNDTVWGVSGGSANFKLLDTGGKASFGQPWLTHVQLKTDLSDTSGTDTTLITLSSRFSPCTTLITFEATAIGPTQDSSTFLFPSAEPEAIAIQSNSDTTSRLFYFKNDSSSAIIVDSIKVTQTSAFAITSAPSLPDTIPSNDSFAVGLAYYRSSQGSDNGELVVSVPNEPILFEAALEGVRIANDEVQTHDATSTYIWLYPNPSHGSVTIHTEHLRQTSVTITDVLGRVLVTSTFDGDWQWNGETSGGPALAGTYFVLVTGRDSNGAPVHEVRRLVLQ